MLMHTAPYRSRPSAAAASARRAAGSGPKTEQLRVCVCAGGQWEEDTGIRVGPTDSGGLRIGSKKDSECIWTTQTEPGKGLLLGLLYLTGR